MKNTPELRFPEFNDDWIPNTLEKVATIVGGGTPDSTIEEYWNGDIQWFTPSEVSNVKYV